MKAMFLGLLAAAAHPQQFELQCTGAGGISDSTTLNWAATNEHLRIDLGSGKWCDSDCSVIHDIAEVQPGRIWLEKQSDYEKAHEIVHFRSVDRVSGEYTRIEEGRASTLQEKGQCTLLPFRGFPPVATKF